MKREICCPSCANSWQQSMGIQPGKKVDELDAALRAREMLHIVRGTAGGSFRCDGCGADIDRGEDCAAVSLSTPEAPYFEWETSYIDIGGAHA